MRILVTGATGLVGKNLCPRLKELGHTVFGITRRICVPNCSPYDINNYDSVAKMMEDIRPDAVIHLAANSKGQPPDSTIDRWNLLTDNIKPAFNMLEYCRLSDLRPYFLFASSLVVYDKCPHSAGYDEYGRVAPISLYGISKSATERLFESYSKECGISYTSVRLPAIVGPGLTHGVVKILWNRLLSDEPFTALGPFPGAVKPYVHTDDVNELIVRLIEMQYPNIINLSNNPISIDTVAQTIMDALNVTKPIKWLDNNWATDNLYLSAQNNETIFTLLEYTKKYSSEEAIRKAVL